MLYACNECHTLLMWFPADVCADRVYNEINVMQHLPKLCDGEGGIILTKSFTRIPNKDFYFISALRVCIYVPHTSGLKRQQVAHYCL